MSANSFQTQDIGVRKGKMLTRRGDCAIFNVRGLPKNCVNFSEKEGTIMYCPNCGQENEENGIICQRCGSALKPEHTEVEIEKIENMPKGILGAALGALLGGVVIVLLYQIGLILLNNWDKVFA